MKTLAIEATSVVQKHTDMLFVVRRDRKRKRFVQGEESQGQKKIRTESGAFIPASYKTDACVDLIIWWLM